MEHATPRLVRIELTVNRVEIVASLYMDTRSYLTQAGDLPSFES